MLDSIFAAGSNGIDLVTVLICSLVSIVLGFLIAIVYKCTERGSKHFLVSISVLPIIVQTIIMLVNGNLGMSVAIAGAFSLVRFRSIAGTSKEIVDFLSTVAVSANASDEIHNKIIIIIDILFNTFILKSPLLQKNNDNNP